MEEYASIRLTFSWRSAARLPTVMEITATTQSSGDQNLVMVRVGANYPGEAVGRLTPDGRDIPGDSPENKEVPRIERPGKWFGQ